MLPDPTLNLFQACANGKFCGKSRCWQTGPTGFNPGGGLPYASFHIRQRNVHRMPLLQFPGKVLQLTTQPVPVGKQALVYLFSELVYGRGHNSLREQKYLKRGILAFAEANGRK